jgi:glutamate dehydrogenase
MPAGDLIIKEELLLQLEQMAAACGGDKAVASLRQLLASLYTNTPTADLLRHRPEHLLAAARCLLKLARTRSSGQSLVRVYNPELERDGWHTNQTLIDVVTRDSPFIADSLFAELDRLDVPVDLALFAVLRARRDDTGELDTLEATSTESPHDTAGPDSTERPDGGGSTDGAENPDNPGGSENPPECFLQFRVRTQGSSRLDAIRDSLCEVLRDVNAAVSDFAAMRARTDQLIRSLQVRQLPVSVEEKQEALEFLTWLNRNHFIYVGYRYCVYPPGRQHALHQDGLGILRNPEREVFEDFQPPDRYDILRIFKANRRSQVHRPVHLDAIVLPDLGDPPGNNEGEPPASRYSGVHLFVGLFTLSAYSRSPRAIPYLRRKVQETFALSKLSSKSYEGRLLRFVLETYPRDELFQIPVDQLLQIALGVVQLQNRQRVALFVRKDPFGRFASCLIYIPRDRLDVAVRTRIESILAESFKGSITAQYTHVGTEALARVHLIVKTPKGIDGELDLLAVERKVWEATRSWRDRLQAALMNEVGDTEGAVLTRTYGDAFPLSYQERHDEHDAVLDIACLDQVLENRELALQTYRPRAARKSELGIKVFNLGSLVQLSDALPILENMGLRASSEMSYQIRPEATGASIWIHDFSLHSEDDKDIDVERVQKNFNLVLTGALRNKIENDGFNRLVLSAGLGPRELLLLRAYAKFLRQCRVPFSLEYMQQTLKRHGQAARLLAELFQAKFLPHDGQTAPSSTLSAPRPIPSIESDLSAALNEVKSLDEDRILRGFANAIGATLRTNLYQRDSQGNLKDYVALKFESGKLTELVAPRPYREIFVFSPRMEGVHLRFGPVSRGGIRWSDRLEDFRTEVLDLVKAQQVKNAVIVPVGAKGGFVAKRAATLGLLRGREAAAQEGLECYRTFIRALLDVTDNLKNDIVVPPANVVRLDGPDPYLVVAADKGTATFSDVANALSQSYSFWLDDAFASGGSAGYDHKKMGITARGAWESVKRHFRELGKDTQAVPFSCIGVGDMSGDVFGNGLLQSAHTCLLAAFNHQHIFIDPCPEPQATFLERQRLFALPRSTWLDYDITKISEGGGIYERSAKSIALSPLAQRALGINLQATEQLLLTPNALIVHLLKAPVELLFFGGIGTYIKASDEADQDVGDRANDALRVAGRDVRAKVICEGANLGVTQRGRIEYAERGGRSNTDFIDNSAGVDCSDHEVNIKILLTEVEAAGQLTRAERNTLLSTMTQEVADLVLRDNYLQTQALSVTEHIGPRFMDRLARSMRELERMGHLDRGLMSLPDVDALLDRARDNLGFWRPELCFLLSSSKIALHAELLSSTLPDDPWLEVELGRYFPKVLGERFMPFILKHRLRREIIATQIANDLVNRVGITFCNEVSERVGASYAAVATAYVAARELQGAPRFWAAIEQLDNHVPAALQMGLLVELGRLLVITTTWLLKVHNGRLELGSVINGYAPGVERIGQELETLLPAAERAAAEQRARALENEGVPPVVARRAATLGLMAAACDIVDLARATGRSVEPVARAYFEVGERYRFEWLRGLARRLPVRRAWDKQAISALMDELAQSQHELVGDVLRCAPEHGDVESALGAWETAHEHAVARSLRVLAELETSPSPDFAMLAVASRQLGSLARTPPGAAR